MNIFNQELLIEFYQIEGLSTAKDEVDGALNIAIFEQMFAPVIAKGVLKSIHSAVVERRIFSCNFHRHRLSPHSLSIRPRCRILTRTNIV